MGKLKAILFLLFTCGISTLNYAQNELDAEIISGDIDVCNSGAVQVTLDIKFYGVTPYQFKFKSRPGVIEGSGGWVYAEDLDPDNVYQFTYTLDLTIPDGQRNASHLIQITEITNNGTTWEKTTDPGITFTNWAMPTPNAGLDIDSCGLTATLDATPDPISSTYYWETPSEGELSDLNDINSTYSVNNPGNYPLTFTQENGACLAQNNVEVIFRGSPSASISTTSEVCGTDPQEATLNISFEGNNSPWSYTITDNNNDKITGISSIPSYTETIVAEGETTYSLVSVVDSKGCPARLKDLTGNAIVTDLLPETNAGQDTEVCGLSAELAAIPDQGNGIWSSSSPQINITSPTNPASSVSASEWGTYTLTWSESNGHCTASDEVSVRFDETPEPNAGEDFTVYNQTQTTVRARNPLTSDQDWTGEWYILSGSGNISTSTNIDATLAQLQHGTTKIEWEVTNGVCPPVSDQLVVTVKGLTYYTGISPSPKDGLNDFFTIKGAHTIPQNELIIFDQNGKVVYKASNLEDNNQWDGTDKAGKPLENGIYYFIFKGDGIDPVKDYIVIKRN